MPIVNTTKGIDLQQRVTVVGNFFARLVGLLGIVPAAIHISRYEGSLLGVETLLFFFAVFKRLIGSRQYVSCRSSRRGL
jgi:hypothetical protein